MVVIKVLVYDVKTGKSEEIEKDIVLPPTEPIVEPLDIEKVKKIYKEIINVDTKEVTANKFSAPNASLGATEITTTGVIHHGKSFSKGIKEIEDPKGLILHSPTKKWCLQVSDEGIISVTEVI